MRFCAAATSTTSNGLYASSPSGSGTIVDSAVSGSHPMLVSLWGTVAAGARVDRVRAVNVSACVHIRAYVLPSAVRDTNYELPVF